MPGLNRPSRLKRHLEALRHRAAWLARRIAEAKAHGRNSGFSEAERAAIEWAIELAQERIAEKERARETAPEREPWEVEADRRLAGKAAP